MEVGGDGISCLKLLNESKTKNSSLEEYISTVLGNYATYICTNGERKTKSPKKKGPKKLGKMVKKFIQNFTQDCNLVAFPLRDYSTALPGVHRLAPRHQPTSALILRNKIIILVSIYTKSVWVSATQSNR